MWIAYAFLGAFFAGVTAVLAKIGIRNVGSNLAVALRTAVVAVFAWVMVCVAGGMTSGGGGGIGDIDATSLAFLVLSGLATGASWLCYFRALALGDVNKVAVVDKTSSVLAMILAFVFLGEELSSGKILSMCLIVAGTCMMIEKSTADNPAPRRGGWLAFALLAAVFAGATAVLAKIGLADIESTLATAIRTLVVLAMAWGIVLARGGQNRIKRIRRRDWMFILLSGVATGLSWLFFYRALQEGPVSVVVPIDKLSLLVTVAFGCFVLREKLTPLAAGGLALVTAGTLALAL